MGRCPDYLNVDDLDRLAESHGLALTDDGVSVLGELVEFIATDILRAAASERAEELKAIDREEIVRATQARMIDYVLDEGGKKIIRARVLRWEERTAPTESVVRG